MTAFQREAFAGDVAFNEAAGLPGGTFEIALFHYAIDGLLFDRLTTSIDPGTSTDAVVDALVEGLLPEAGAVGRGAQSPGSRGAGLPRKQGT
jgi:hypothetical protein